MALQNVEANITLDLYNHDTTPATVKAIQLDSQTRYVAAMLQSMGAEYGIDSGATVQLIVIRPDKVGVQITGTTFTYGDEGAQFLGPYAELTQVALAVNGKMRGQFKITSGTQILRTEIFTISNGEALDASTDEWADEYDGYNLEEMATSIETNTADIASLEADVSQIKEDLSDMVNSTYVTDSADGAVAHFVDGADDVPMKSVKVNIAPVQSGSGDPSPSNVRAISGKTSVTVTRAGKNLVKPLAKTESGLTLTPQSDGGLLINGTYTGTTGWYVISSYVALKKGRTYTLSLGGLEATFGLNGFGNTNPVTPNADFTSNFRLRIESGQTFSNVVVYPQVEVGTSATDFEPYIDSTSYDISLASAGTVYGGTLDVVSGVLTVDKGFVTLDGTQTIANRNWRATSNSVGWLYPYSVTQNVVPNSSTEVPDVISNRVKTASYSAAYNGTENNCVSLVYDTSKAYGLAVRYDNTLLTTDAAINAFLAENPIQVVYSLANPSTYQLTPHQVNSLLGVNNVWSDAGDIECEYRADTKLYIDKRLGV